MNQNNEFLKICQQVNDKELFNRFLEFCAVRLKIGQDTATIWAAWQDARRAEAAYMAATAAGTTRKEPTP